MAADQAASRIGTTTADFCAGVGDCTARLSVALAAYRDGDTEAFHEAAAETACDDDVANTVEDGADQLAVVASATP